MEMTIEKGIIRGCAYKSSCGEVGWNILEARTS